MKKENQNAIATQIKNCGGKITKTRLAVIKMLFTTPLTSGEIALKLKHQKINVNRTTIYRELLFLVNNKIARTFQNANGDKYYEISNQHHHHLICTKCNVIKEISHCPELKKQEKNLSKKEKFKITGHALEFFGLCPKCK